MNLRSAYLTTEQAAQQLGISRRTLGRAVDRGEIAWDRQTPGGWALLLTTDVAAFAQCLSTQRTVARQRSAPAASRRAEEAPAALRQSGDVLRALSEHTTDLVSVIGAEGVLLYASPSYERVLGYAPQEVVGQRVLTIIHPDDKARVQELLTALRQAQGPLSTELCLRHRDGSWRRMEATAANHLTDPVVGGIIATMRDITVRTQTAERLRFQAHLLETVGQAIIATDVTGVITYWNHAADALYGWPAAEALGRNILTLLPTEPFRARDAETLTSVADSGPSSGEYLGRHRDGHAIPILATAVPIRDEQGAVVGLISGSTDISARVQAEQALRESERFAYANKMRY